MGASVSVVGDTTTVRDAAWGLRFPSLSGVDHVLVAAPSWPAVDLDLQLSETPDVDDSSDWTEQGMHVHLAAGGRLEITWPANVRLRLPGHPLPECVVQPHLTTAAASIALHGGLQAFHAGAFVVGGRAWAVLGAKESGKSSTLALAERRAASVVTDDLLVVDRGEALVGPRCVDLREEAATFLGVGEPLGIVGLRERWRIRVGACPSQVPMAGWVLPSWGKDAVTPVATLDRLRVLLANVSMQGLTMNDPDEYLRLAALPMLAWSRPKGWDTAAHSFDLLLQELDHDRK
jgi:hypothetical protein